MRRPTFLFLAGIALAVFILTTSCGPANHAARKRIPITGVPQLTEATMLAAVGAGNLPDIRNRAAIIDEARGMYAGWLHSQVSVADMGKGSYTFVGPAMCQSQRIEVDYPEMHVRLTVVRKSGN